MSSQKMASDFNKLTEEAARFDELFETNTLDDKCYCVKTVISSKLMKILLKTYCIQRLRDGKSVESLPYFIVKRSSLDYSITKVKVPKAWAAIVVGRDGRNIKTFEETFQKRISVLSLDDCYETDRSW